MAFQIILRGSSLTASFYLLLAEPNHPALNLLSQPFIDYLKFEKRYSAHTVRAYSDDLDQFFLLSGNKLWRDTPGFHYPPPFIRCWLASLKEQKITSKSINRKISSLKSFFKYLLRTGIAGQITHDRHHQPKIG